MRKILAEDRLNGKPNKGGSTNMERMVSTLVTMAIAGDTTAANIILERIELRVPTAKSRPDELIDALAVRAIKLLIRERAQAEKDSSTKTPAEEKLEVVAKLTKLLRGQADPEHMSGEALIRAALDRIHDEDVRYGVESMNGDEDGLEGPP
jgi:hypothetical protein